MKKLNLENFHINKFFLISICMHLLLFLNYRQTKTLGEVHFNNKLNIPVSINLLNLEPRIDNFKSVQGSEAPKKKLTEQIKEEKKLEKKEIQIDKKLDEDTKKKLEEVIQNTDIKEVLELPKESIIEKEILEETKHEDSLPEEEINENSKIEAQEKISETETRNLDEDTNKSENLSEHLKEDIKNITVEDEFLKTGNFTLNSDGSYTAISAQGINFEILYEVDPIYPKQAEVIRYNKDVTISVRFLVDQKGSVENIEILQSHKKFGFDKEVIKTLKRWKFKPIEYQGEIIKVYFHKEFIFNSKA